MILAARWRPLQFPVPLQQTTEGKPGREFVLDVQTQKRPAEAWHRGQSQGSGQPVRRCSLLRGLALQSHSRQVLPVSSGRTETMHSADAQNDFAGRPETRINRQAQDGLRFLVIVPPPAVHDALEPSRLRNRSDRAFRLSRIIPF